MNRRLRPADALLRPDVTTSLAALSDLGDVDAAAAKLARLYATEIDRAAELAAELDDLDTEDVDRLAAIQARVEAQKVLASLGPKLLAVLVELGATPRARAKPKGGTQDGKPGKLQALRDASA